MPKRKLVLSRSFEKAFLKMLNKKPHLVSSIKQSIIKLEEDAFFSSIKTHKLSGNLLGYYACSCGYDCRIVFSIEKDKITLEEVILLIDIGTHDEVY